MRSRMQRVVDMSFAHLIICRQGDVPRPVFVMRTNKNQSTILEATEKLGANVSIFPPDGTNHVEDPGMRSIKFSLIAGVIDRKKKASFERMLWRISKGGCSGE